MSSPPTRLAFQQKNIDMIRDLVIKAGAGLVPDAPFTVEGIDSPGRETSVHLTLATPTGSVVLRIENRNPDREAFAHTPSFSIAHFGEATHEQATTLRAFIDALAKHDAGDLKLIQPSHVG